MMSAARFRGQGRIEFTQKPVPEPGTGQLLVQVKANALCGSERDQIADGVPVTPGHEVAGIVAAAGPVNEPAPAWFISLWSVNQLMDAAA